MDEATLARATEPFFTTKGSGKGTGLGLPMVHGLAAQSGGHLDLRSQPGRGTVAAIWLPVVLGGQPDPASEQSHPLSSDGAASPITVLLVDDDPLVLDTAAAMLADDGHSVIVRDRAGRHWTFSLTAALLTWSSPTTQCRG